MKQPKGLYILFFTEMWDRLGYYGIQSILVLYLVKKMFLNDDQAYTYFGIFTTLAFTMPVLGGYIADRYIGHLRAIYNGIMLIIIGNSILFLFQISELKNQLFIFVGLSLITLGIGLFKSNNVGLLSTLYQANDNRKDTGFTIFYMGMNLGGILGPIVFGLLAIRYGFSFGFLLSIIGFLLSFMLYKITRKKYLAQAVKIKLSNSIIFLLWLGIAALLLMQVVLYHFPDIFNWMLGIFVLIIFVFIASIAKHQERQHQKHIIYILILYLFSMCYFAASMQVGSSLTLFINRYVNRDILGYHIPTAAFSALEPIFIIMLAPFFAFLWGIWEKKHKSPTMIFRVIAGLFFAGISFVIFSAATFQNQHISSFGLIVLGNIPLSAGELLIGPAMMLIPTKLLPENLHATFIGIYFLFTAFAAYIASLLAKLSATPIIASKVLHEIDVYRFAFNRIALLTFLACVALALISLFIKKLLHQDVFDE